MALAPLATPVDGTTTLTAALWNNEFLNIYHNANSLISPFTGNVDVNNKQLTNVRVENITATPTAANAGRAAFHTTFKQFQVDDGAQIRQVPALYGSTGPNQIVVATSAGQYGFGPKMTTFTGSCVWPAFNNDSVIATTISASGALVGDVVLASHTTVTAASVVISGRVTGSGTVTVSLYNGTGAVYNPGSGTLRVIVLSYV